MNETVDTLRKQLDDYEKLLDLLRNIGATLAVDKVLEHLSIGALELCHAQQCAIVLFDPDTQTAAKTLIRQKQSSAELLDHYLNTLLTGWVLDNKKAQISHDLRATFGEPQIPEKYRGISSVLSTPLEWRGEIIGVMNLLAYKGQELFGERELRLMQVLASQCAQFIVNAKVHTELFSEAARLRRQLPKQDAFHGIIGRSPKMQAVFDLVERIVPTDARVLIEGESGTGKERIARILHFNGLRKNKPFVAIDCGAMPANLLESELFGYVKGAFTGASQDKKGLFEEAGGGTLFLDEIGNMPVEIQAKFLRSIQEGEIRPLGLTQMRKVDVRIIAAAGSDLRQKMTSGEFRQDLFYRLNIVNVQLPPLRDRSEDIVVLATYFLQQMAQKYNKTLTGLHPQTALQLETYSWPGNVRELENVVERMAVLADAGQSLLPPELLPPEMTGSGFIASPAQMNRGSVKDKKDAFEKQLLLEALERNNWNQSAVARELGIHEKTVRYKMSKFQLKSE